MAGTGRRGAQPGTAIDKIEETSILLKSGETLAADVVYKCVGVMPNTGMLKGSPYEGKGFRDSVEVNDYLQVEAANVYCVEDMMSHTSRELKLGHTAEINAHMAAHNIAADLHGKPLGKYPRAITGADWSPKIYCLSLGKYDAVASLNGLILTGWYVAVLKWLLEWTKVAAAGERPVGVFFWWFADNVSNYMSRTLLPPPGKEEERDVVESLSWLHDVGMLPLRIITASLMMHHGLDKLQHVEGFSNNVIAVYFPFLPGPPEFWTNLSASFELGGSFILVVGGIFVRPAALLLMGTMVNAVAFQLMANGLQGYPFGVPSGGAYTFEPSLAFFGVTLYIALAGPGGFSCRSAPSKPMTSCMM